MSEESRLSHRDLAQVTSRAAVDVEYRQRLLTDPQAALAEQLGPVSGGVKVRFIEKDASVDALIVLPDLAASGRQSSSATAPTPQDDALARVTHRAAVDAHYRQRLLTSPREALKEHLGTTIRAGIRVRFMEKPAGLDVLVVLPDLVAGSDALTIEDLHAVAGGADTELSTCQCSYSSCDENTCGCSLVDGGASCAVTDESSEEESGEDGSGEEAPEEEGSGEEHLDDHGGDR